MAWAFFNALAVNSTLFINNSSRAITLLVNWQSYVLGSFSE
ncbi:hypothetical protein ALTER154_90228 [Alteromonas sp. 154]|nr:hypothetical protein ALTER154_90228 [Alteromonas sp. 154]